MVEEYITSDSQARDRLASIHPESEAAKFLIKIAQKTADGYSYVENQTYPRPGHPKLEKRLSPLFTFAAIITSLRCTLEVESRVTDELILQTDGDDEKLLRLGAVTIQDIIRPAGMAKQKSEWIFNGIHEISNNKEYSIENLTEKTSEVARQDLLKLKGIGQKAVDCFLLLGLEKPVFPVDTNVFKIVCLNFPELFNSNTEPKFTNPKQVQVVKNFLENTFPKNTEDYQILHTYLLLAEKHRINL